MTRAITAVTALAGALLVAASGFVGEAPRLVYNPSDSAPHGFYRVGEPDAIRVGDYVIARLPEALAALAAERGYLPRSVPVLKQVAALGGQLVCVRGDTVLIDGVVVANVLENDSHDRPLRTWDHCRRLMEREVFLLNSASPASFDSRYFGPIDVSFLRGRATRW